MIRLWRLPFLLAAALSILVQGEAAEIRQIQPSMGDTETSLLVQVDSGVVPSPRFISEEDCWHIDFLKTTSCLNPSPQVLSQGPLQLVRLVQVCEDPPIQRLFCHIRPGSTMKLRQAESSWVITFKQGTGIRPLPAEGDAKVSGLMSPAMTEKEILIRVRKTQTAPLFLELATRAGVSVQFRDPPKPSAVNLHGRDPLVLMQDLARHLGMRLTLEDGVWWLSNRGNPLLNITTAGSISTDSLTGLTVSEAIERVAGKAVSRKLQNRLPRKIRERRLEPQPERKLCPRRWVEQILEAHGTNLTPAEAQRG